MTKRTAWTCCISATLVVGGYVAWCGRTFYLEPPMDFSKATPEAEEVAPQLAREVGLLRRERFSVSRLWHYLHDPYGPRFHSIEVRHRPARLNLMMKVSGGGRAVLFMKKSGKWTFTKHLF